MSSAGGAEVLEAAKGNFPGIEKGLTNETPENYKGDLVTSDSEGSDVLHGPNGEVYPTEEEIKTLRRTHGPIPWEVYSIAFVELCERFAYYGTTAVFVNFIQLPLPDGSTTGASGTDGQAGALGFGQRASTGLVLFNNFWSYIMPILGGYLADTFWGRFKTIQWAIAIAIVGHIILIVSAIPQVISNPNGALGCFVVGLIFFGIGVGWFKCNISPLIAEQYERDHPRLEVITLKTGERVISDPTMTISRIYMRYYWMINVGALIGQISMVYAEKYVGFWLSFLLPTIMFFLCPIVMIWCQKKYVKRPPTGSVLSKAVNAFKFAMKGRWSLNPIKTFNAIRAPDFWDAAKPSRVPEGQRPAWMTFDDVWVDELRRGFKACTVFAWYPIYWLSYSQMQNNMVSQAGTMYLGGVPNDVVNNLNPFTLLIFIPIFDKLIYPALAKAGIRFTPIKKITFGFFSGALSMMVAAVIQHFIYVQSPCGYNASNRDCIEAQGPPPLSVWIQTPSYLLITFAEIFASIVGLEYAFTKAPKNMRSLVTGVFWVAQAFSSAIAQAFVGLSDDPLLVWLYTTIAIISALGGIGFWFTFNKLDKEEDQLNALPESTYQGRHEGDIDVEAVEAERERQEKIRKAQGMVAPAPRAPPVEKEA